MPVPFGISVGDFIAGVKFIKDVIDASSDARGARRDYNNLIQTLVSLERALSEATQYTTPQHEAAISEAVANCKNCISVFLVDIAKFELLKDGTVSAKKWRRGLRKIQWSLCKQDDVEKFTKQLHGHVDALKLHCMIFHIAELSLLQKIAEETKKATADLSDQTVPCITRQEERIKSVQVEQKNQTQLLSNLDERVESANLILVSQMNEIGKELKRGLSLDMQHTLCRLLEESVKRQKHLELELITQHQTLTTHILELKAMVQAQQSIPAQVMLQQPVVLIDAFEGHRLPFHLEFINSFEVLFTVLQVRFKDKGEIPLYRLQARLFDIYEMSRQQRIDLKGQWSGAIRPGQFIEMTMLHVSSTLAQSCCPACGHKRHGVWLEKQKVKCAACPMTYRWSKQGADVLEDGDSDLSIMGGGLLEDDLSQYCRLDIIRPPAGLKSSRSRREMIEGIMVWYCESCGDGPYSDWQPSCSNCSKDRVLFQFGPA